MTSRGIGGKPTASPAAVLFAALIAATAVVAQDYPPPPGAYPLDDTPPEVPTATLPSVEPDQDLRALPLDEIQMAPSTTAGYPDATTLFGAPPVDQQPPAPPPVETTSQAGDALPVWRFPDEPAPGWSAPAYPEFTGPAAQTFRPDQPMAFDGFALPPSPGAPFNRVWESGYPQALPSGPAGVPSPGALFRPAQ